MGPLLWAVVRRTYGPSSEEPKSFHHAFSILASSVAKTLSLVIGHARDATMNNEHVSRRRRTG